VLNFRNINVYDLLISVIPALICIILHEMSHGYVAYRLGDRTAKEMGRLTLNPLKHIDVIGLLFMMAVGFGWAKPVPINPFNFKRPKRGMALTALAGPVTNLLIAVVFLFLFGLIYPLKKYAVGSVAVDIVSITAQFSITLAIFNILPIPPMDGSKVFFAIATDETYFKLMKYERYGLILIMILSFSGKLWGPLGTAVSFVYEKLFFFAQAGNDLIHLIIG
jgi:Zn-dependent protease